MCVRQGNGGLERALTHVRGLLTLHVSDDQLTRLLRSISSVERASLGPGEMSQR